MIVIIQLLTIAGMFFLTFVAFQAFGPSKKGLLFSKDDKEEWDKSFSTGLGKWFTLTNIVGTLTSLATAYLFFIGSSKLFGWVILMCCLTIWAGAFVTNFVTNRIIKTRYIKDLLDTKEQVAGVIATLFWRPNNKVAISTSKIIKWISILNIAAVIWLEFSIFSDIASRLFLIDNILYRTIILFLTTFVVLLFTLKFGLRGFVFADAFQSPLIALSAIALVIGSIILFNQTPIAIPVNEFIKPVLSYKDCSLFAVHVLFLNTFLVLVTEGHWLRVWIFGNKEKEMQNKSLFSTAIVWLLLIIIGFFASSLSNGKIGEDAIISLINSLSNISTIFLIFFWLGGIAALFSTADAQIYSLLLVNEFNPKTGKLNNRLMDRINPWVLSILISIAFTLVYFLVRKLNLPFEKIVFIIMPLCLNILPAFVRAFKGYEQKPILIVVSVILYLICSTIGLLEPQNQLAWTLSAALMPFLISIFALKK